MRSLDAPNRPDLDDRKQKMTRFYTTNTSLNIYKYVQRYTLGNTLAIHEVYID